MPSLLWKFAVVGAVIGVLGGVYIQRHRSSKQRWLHYAVACSLEDCKTALGPVDAPANPELIRVYETDMKEKLFQLKDFSPFDIKHGSCRIDYDTYTKKQRFLGFGALLSVAMTSLGSGSVVESIFGKTGLEYNFGIKTKFATKKKPSKEDKKYPQTLFVNFELCKQDCSMNEEKCFNLWTQRIINHIKESNKRGVIIDTMVVINSLESAVSFPSTNESISIISLVTQFLIPNFKLANLTNIKVIMSVDSDNLQIETIETLYSESSLSTYITGISINGTVTSSVLHVLALVQKEFPNKLIFLIDDARSIDSDEYIPNWSHAENLASDIINAILHGLSGWIDMDVARFDDTTTSSIMVDKKNGKFYRFPSYFAKAHISKFVKVNSTVVEAKSSCDDLESVGVYRTDGRRIIVLANRGETAVNFSVKDISGRRTFGSTVLPHTLQTYIWRAF